MRFRLGAAVLLIAAHPGFAQAQAPCEQAAFAAVVSEASATLAAMNADNKAAFQARLASLKAREGWADGDYAAKATPFARDATTTRFDDSNKALLGKVPQLGGTMAADATGAIGALAGDRRCAMLEDLRALMGQVVENTRAKWAHMLGKLDAALEDSRQARAAGQ